MRPVPYLFLALMASSCATGPDVPMPFGDPRAGGDPVADARADLAAGHPRYFVVGRPSRAVHDAAPMLERDLGVHVELVGCFVDDEVIAYAHEYNATINAQLDAEHGPDVRNGIWSEVERLERVRRAKRERWVREHARTAVQTVLWDGELGRVLRQMLPSYEGALYLDDDDLALHRVRWSGQRVQLVGSSDTTPNGSLRLHLDLYRDDLDRVVIELWRRGFSARYTLRPDGRAWAIVKRVLETRGEPT